MTHPPTANALGEEPELDPMARPLTVGEFLEDKGLSAAERQVYAYTEADRPLFEQAWRALSASVRAGR